MQVSTTCMEIQMPSNKPQRFWIVRQGTAKAKVRADTYEAARLRAAQIGFGAPDSIVLAE